MRRKRYRLLFVLIALLAGPAGGCVPEQYSEFRGTVDGDTVPVARTVQTLGQDFHYRKDDAADAITGFGLAESRRLLVIVHDRKKFVAKDLSLTDDAVSAVYLVDWSRRNDEPGKVLFNMSEAARDSAEGMYRLNGSLHVERWKSNIDFRIQLAMTSAGPHPVRVDGILTTYERQEFKPMEWLARELSAFGFQ